MIQSIKIPTERVGVLIGKNGETKGLIEKLTGVTISVDSEEGDVQIDLTHAKDPGGALAVLNVVAAIGRGFSPEKAMRLLEDEFFMEVLDIRDYVGKKHEHVIRMRARVIGTHGKTRALIEELTGAHVSVYGNTVAVIGDSLQLDIAHRALDMLLSGSEHAAVYNFLEKMRARLKIDGMGF
ncbi:MAG: RNA-processing protein [Euryarchaeota archaeon RBG_16_62_10]|nr:MAG: RNA-processing protein [Euryarchaeota archaeon RBG_16_62_10]